MRRTRPGLWPATAAVAAGAVGGEGAARASQLAPEVKVGVLAMSLDDVALAPLLQPLVAGVGHCDGQVAKRDTVIAALATASIACERLMAGAGAGLWVTLTSAAGGDDPIRFSASRIVGAPAGQTRCRPFDGSQRRGLGKAKVALACKLPVVLHHVRTNGYGPSA